MTIRVFLLDDHEIVRRGLRELLTSESDIDVVGDDTHLTFRKHTPALEWDRPIKIVSYEWTAWKENDDDGGYLDLGLV